MTHLTLPKKAAVVLLLISFLVRAIQPPAVRQQGAPLIRRMGIATNVSGPSNQVFDGSSLTLLANSSGRQMLSMVLQSSDGSLVVIDGGWSMDAYHLTQVIQEYGGHVSAWFLTHPHNDHVGAFMEIANDPDSPITIDHVYYSLADQSWYDAREGFRSGTVAQLRETLSRLPTEKLHGDMQKGQTLSIGNLSVEFMNTMYLMEDTSVNNSSMVLKLTMDDVSILVLGDLGPEGGRQLLTEHSPDQLKCDVVQMAHHGQSGVERDVYAAISPDICLWPTPLWLWNNDTGKGFDTGTWSTLETRRWMEELGVSNHYATKDGRWVIR